MSDQNTQPMIELSDIMVAGNLLSRLPFPVDNRMTKARAPIATWAYPLIGALIGLIAGLLGAALLALNVPAGIASVIALLVMAALSGGLHEDGLADCADGFWGGNDRERRLEIMKDSRIGVYGALALMLFTMARWSAISEFSSDQFVLVLIAAGAISRVPMVIAMLFIPNARGDGMSATVGPPPPYAAVLNAGIAIVIAVLMLGLFGLAAAVAVAIVCAAFFAVAARKIGGQTGDVLGASQQIAEVTVLAVFVSSM